MRGVFLLLLLALAADESWWSVQSTGVDSNLRGIAAVVHRSGTVLWVTGSKGTILRSADAGQTWNPVHIAGTENLDFRGVQTFDGKTVYVMSIGAGEQSRIFKSSDGGQHWDTQYTDKRKSFFLDALVCSEATHCFALSDPVDGKFLLLATNDGDHWKELPRDRMPAALPKEGVFAASNSSLLLYGKSELYFATGGPSARVFHSPDLGQTWDVTDTPVVSGKPSQGIFSIVRAGDTVVVVGGDYSEPSRKEKTAGYSSDEGKTWHLAEDLPKGFRSSVDTFDAGFVAVGPNGAETSRDGIHWLPIDSPELNAVTFISGQGWAVGAKGAVAHFIDRTPYSTQWQLPPITGHFNYSRRKRGSQV
jgi:photosystem II stability/assembly factor-like uncharacterized protein